MNPIRGQRTLTTLLAFIIGTLFGLVVLGWYVIPVQWTNARIQHLGPDDQALLLRTVADLYALEEDAVRVQRALGGWHGEVAACRLAASSSDPAEAARLRAIVQVVTDQECSALTTVDSPGNVAESQTIPLLALTLLMLIVAILLVNRRRRALLRPAATETDRPIIQSASETALSKPYELAAQPLGESRTDYRAPAAGAKLSRRERRRQRWLAASRRWREAWRIFVQSRIAMVGCTLLLIFGLMPLAHVGLRATIWQSKKYDPIYGFEMDSMPNPAPPSWIPADWLAAENAHRFDLNRPSFQHLLGTDPLGRDVLSVLLASTTTTFIVGITAALSTAAIGVSIGTLSAYYRGPVDRFFTHISDAFLLLPPPIFMIAAGIFLQTQRTTLSEIVLSNVTGSGFNDNAKLFLQPLEFGLIYGLIAGAGGAAIVLRSHGLKVMSLSFVEASRVSGASGRHIIWRHLVPHMLPLATVYMMVVVTGAVVADGFLAFFGLNPNPLNWGTMIYNAFTYSTLNFVTPWNALAAPATAISLFTAAFYMVSRGLHRVVEPRLREEYMAREVPGD